MFLHLKLKVSVPHSFTLFVFDLKPNVFLITIFPASRYTRYTFLQDVDFDTFHSTSSYPNNKIIITVALSDDEGGSITLLALTKFIKN